MTDLSDDWEITGWGYMTDGSDVIEFAFEDWHIDWVAELEGDDLPSDVHYGYDLGKRIRKVKFQKCLFGARGDIEEFLDTLNSWNQSAPFTLKIQVDSTPTYFKADGSSTTLTVLWESIRDITKIAAGDVQMYAVQTITFRQKG